MGFVLDPPVRSNCKRGEFGLDRSIGEIERGFRGGLPEAGGGLEDVRRALDANKGGHVRLPFRPVDGGLGVEHGNCAGFVTVAAFPVDSLDARLRHRGGARGFGFLTQDWLVVLELND